MEKSLKFCKMFVHHFQVEKQFFFDCSKTVELYKMSWSIKRGCRGSEPLHYHPLLNML